MKSVFQEVLLDSILLKLLTLEEELFPGVVELIDLFFELPVFLVGGLKLGVDSAELLFATSKRILEVFVVPLH